METKAYQPASSSSSSAAIPAPVEEYHPIDKRLEITLQHHFKLFQEELKYQAQINKDGLDALTRANKVQPFLAGTAVGLGIATLIAWWVS